MTSLEYLLVSVLSASAYVLYGRLLVEIIARGVDGHEWWRRP